jgi:DNA repair protein RecN (Recombination protein N)
MLKQLEIENYILIDHLEIHFFEGFSVITGETGAGKSILLGALELILGNRADTQVLLDKEKKCIIEGTFFIGEYGLQDFFRNNDLDYDIQLILRREISPSGKSRAFINDSPVNLSQMKDLGSMLVNIHSQNSITTLNQSDFQLAVLDSFAGISALTQDFKKKYLEFSSNEKRLDHLLTEEEKVKTEEDYLLFQLSELNSAQLEADEQNQLEENLNLLSHAEEIKENLFQAGQMIISNELNVLGMLAEVQSKLRRISSYHTDFSELLARLESGIIEIKDIAHELNRAEATIAFNPEELEHIKARLDLLYRLQSKHRVQTVKELLDIRDNLELQVQGISSLDEQIRQLKVELAGQKEELEQLAVTLSSDREKAVPAFEMEITGLIRHMGMPHATFKIALERRPFLTSDGADRITFLFNANPGHEAKPLSDVASGGELSRVMLAIKAMISQKNLLPTIIFDEIDNGISGDIAGRVGDVLLKTAAKMQLIAITHLPQIAGKASVQYNVEKKISGNKTVSGIHKLDHEERVAELAKMISGQDVTEASRQTARELLSQVSVFDN